MNLHEYQAKKLFADYGIPVPEGKTVSSPSDARAAAQELGGEVWLVKTQAHTGGRGKAGGVTLAKSLDEVEAAAEAILGMTLVTKQTGPEGLPVNLVLVEQGSDIARELYLGALLDRACFPRLPSWPSAVRWHEHRGGGRRDPGENPHHSGRSGRRPATLPVPQARLRSGAGG